MKQVKIKYTPEMIAFITLKFETIGNNTAIARLVNKHFELGLDDVQPIRNYVSRLRRKLKKRTSKYQPKRLFYDIETGYYKAPVFGCFNQYIKPENLEGEKKVICVSYHWQGSDDVKTLKWKKVNGEWCDKELMRKFIKELGKADEIVAHNGDKFDIRELRTRALLNGLLMFPKYRSFDTLKKSRKYFRFPSNKLDFLGDKTQIGRKKQHSGFDLWRRCQEGYSKDDPQKWVNHTKSQIEKEALKEMVEYCEQDVLLLADYFAVISPYVDHNTNFAVIKEGLTGKWKCPECTSGNVELSHTDTTPMGYVKRHMKCNDCKKFYHISNKTYTNYLLKDFYSVS